jgi:hypothetical protein
VASERSGRTVVGEEHRLSGRRLSDVGEEDAQPENEVCEMHCCLLRRSLFDRMGGFDERLITREHMDLALWMRVFGARAAFERRSVVTYMKPRSLDERDLRYFVFRWADALAVRSLDAFESTWDVPVDREYVRQDWIARHRRRGVATRHRWLRACLPNGLFDRLLSARYEAQVVRDVEEALARATAFPARKAPTSAHALVRRRAACAAEDHAD